jgi:hypothetical protein
VVCSALSIASPEVSRTSPILLTCPLRGLERRQAELCWRLRIAQEHEGKDDQGPELARLANCSSGAGEPSGQVAETAFIERDATRDRFRSAPAGEGGRLFR